MTTDELKAIEARIAEAVPGARFSWTDYDFTLMVAHPTEMRAYVVYQAPIPRKGQREIKSNVDLVIEALKG